MTQPQQRDPIPPAPIQVAMLKRSVRELRVAAGAIAVKRSAAACQTTRVEGPAVACQTEWCAVHMPLPALPHGGSWPLGGPRVLLPSRMPSRAGQR